MQLYLLYKNRMIIVLRRNHVMKKVAHRLGRLPGLIMACLLATTTLAACVGTSSSSTTTSNGAGIHKIQHVVVIMQENRSFDSYFGTYPGADGIPMRIGVIQSDTSAKMASRA